MHERNNAFGQMSTRCVKARFRVLDHHMTLTERFCHRASSLRHLKGKPMNWDQIETEWQAMTRRVRSDWPDMMQSGPDEDPPTQPPGDLPEPPLPENELVSAR